MPDPRPGDVKLLLRPVPSDVPVDSRLAKLLKYAGRVVGLKCVWVEIVATEEPGKEQTGSEEL